MILDAKDRFLFKSAYEKGAVKLYERYTEIIKNKGNRLCEKSVDYLKAFVEYSPYKCIKIIRLKENDPFSLIPYGDEYLYLLTSIAAYHLDRNERALGLIWALKAARLFDYFAPTLKKDVREKALYNLVAQNMVSAYRTDSYKIYYNSFMLDWEIKRFYYCGHKDYFNDNEKRGSKIPC